MGEQIKEMGGACSTYGERRSPYRIFVGKLGEGTTWKIQK
jgi:hypothetical protein